MLIKRVTAALAASVLLAVLPATADSVSAPMSVSAYVVARAIVSIDAAPANIEVTDADVARGYVDVSAPIVVRVKTNSPRGYLLQANNVSEAFSRVELSSATTSMSVINESWIQRPYVKGGEVMPLHARLHLAAGVTAGTQALPVAFSATPL